jgi:hypothetical protein
MSDQTVEGLNERELECLAHLEEAKKLGINFSRYCREKQLSFHQWTWIKRALLRKGVIGGRGRTEVSNGGGFLPVRIAPAATTTAKTATPVCLIHHPSGWMIECASYPEVSWISALLAGASR